MNIYPLDKQINVAVKILKLLEMEQVTFSEFDFINELINDNIKCQKDEIELVKVGNKICRHSLADDELIKYCGNSQ